MNGLGIEGCTGTPALWFDHVFSADLELLRSCVQNHVSGSQEWLSCEYRMVHTDGSLRWMTTRAVITRDAHGVALRLSGSQSDITAEKTYDPLTMLPNRVALRSAIEAVFLRHRALDRQTSSGHALLFLDLDGFKTVNDSLGHLAGDALLCSIADKLRDAVSLVFSDRAESSRPLVARMGGDEFAVLIASASSVDEADAFAQQVQLLMREPVLLDGVPVHVAFSIGIAHASPEYESYESVLYDADVAMYAAKANGRGSVMTFNSELRRTALDRLQLENDLRSALDRNEFFLVYQPKIRLLDGSIYGLEALLRWQHPTRGLISPGQFIPVAEETGCILDIGRWVLRHSCEQLMSWQRKYPLKPPVELSVNLSPCEFKQPGLVQGIATVLEETGFPPDCLHLEITEGVLFEDMQRARRSLLQLKELGVGLDLDDFGSGYSSLRYLQELPFDTLKIDRYFLNSLDADLASASRMLETIISMAGHLDMKVIAEGIEKIPHSNLLKGMGCDFGQGFLFSRPVNATAMELLLTNEFEIRARRPIDEGESASRSSLVSSGLIEGCCA